MSRPLGVGELTRYLAQLIKMDGILSRVAVEGEAINVRQGHYTYFDLKDDEAILHCAVFDPLVAAIPVRNGDRLMCQGRVSVYEAGGRYQLHVVQIRPLGLGDELVQFEALKRRLTAEGLFDPARKKPLPALPKRIGLITSLQGAVVHDFRNELELRYPNLELILVHSSVQGEEAPGQLREALSRLQALAPAPDLIVVARGGGANEHLGVFNDELLVRAIAACPIPVITAIGHEVDTTLVDYASDRRASTPTEAAVFAVPDLSELHYQLDELLHCGQGALLRKLYGYRNELTRLLAQLEQKPKLLRLHLFQMDGAPIVAERQIEVGARYRLASKETSYTVLIESNDSEVK